MRHGTDVTRMMTSVQSALARTARSGAAGVVFVAATDENEPVMGRLREDATIKLEFQSGSDRMVVGPAIRFLKRGLRRSLRWYLQPIMEQQSTFNHAVLDIVARMRLDHELLLNELNALRRTLADGGFDDIDAIEDGVNDARPPEALSPRREELDPPP